MKEMDELSSGIQRLKRNSENQKRVIEQLEKDRAFLMERTRFLSQKLSEAYVIYEEAGKRILDFVDKETAPIKNQIGELKEEVKKLSEMEGPLKTHSAYLEKMKLLEQDLKARVAESEKSIRKLNETTTSLRSFLEGVRETEGKEEEALGAHVAEIKGHLEARIKTAEEKLAAKIAEASEEAIQDSNDSIAALSTSHEVLRKRISDGELAIRQLKFGTATLKKHMENAGIARQEIEKKLAVQNALIKEAESAIGKMQRRLDGINLEDDKLEKRLSELRKSSESDIISRAANLKAIMESGHKREMEMLDAKAAQMKMHIDSQHSRQNESLDNRLTAFATEFQGRINALGQRISAREHAIENEILRLRKQAKLEDSALAERMERQAIQLEKKLKQQHAVSELEKAKLQKGLSDHMASINEIQSSIGKITRRLDGISIEDDKLEKRLALLRKATQDEISAKSDALKSQMDITHKRQLELLDSKVRLLSSDFHSRMTGLNDKILAENGRLNAGLQQLAERFAKKMESERELDLRFEKRLAESFKGFEGTMDEKLAKFRLHSDSLQKKHADSLDSHLQSTSQALEARMEKLHEKVAGESAALEARLEGNVDSRFSILSKRLDGIKIEDDKIERRLSELKKHMEREVVEKTGNLKLEMDTGLKEQSQAIESNFASISENLDEKLSGFRESATADSQRLKAHIDDASLKMSDKLVLEKARAAKHLEDFEARIGKRLDGIKHSDDRFEESLGQSLSAFEGSIDQKMAKFKAHSDAANKKHAELAESRLSSVSEELGGKVSRLAEKLASQKESLQRELELSVKDMSNRMEGIKFQDDRFEKHLGHSLSTFEGSIDLKLKKAKSDIEALQKEHAKAIDSHMAELSRKMGSGLQEDLSRVNRRLDAVKIEDGRFEKKLDISLKGFEGQIDTKMHRFKAEVALEGKNQLKAIDSRLASEAEKIDGKFSKLSKRLDSINLEDGSFERKMDISLKGFEGQIDTKMHRFRAETALEGKNQLKAIDARIASIVEKFDGKLESDVSKLTKRLDGIKLEDDVLEKRLSDAKRHAEALVESSNKKFDFSLKGFENQLDTKMHRFRSEVGLEQKNHLKAIDARLASVSEQVNSKLEGSISKLSKRLDSINLEDGSFERKMDISLKGFEGQIDTKMHRFRAETALEGKNQLKAIDARIASIVEKFDGKLESDVSKLTKRLDGIKLEDDVLEKRLSDAKRHAEALVESSNKKSLISLESRMKEIEGELDRKFSSLGEKVASEKLRLKDVQSYIARKIDDSQKINASRLSGLDYDFDKKLSSVYSHVASERKSIGDLRLALEKEIRDEQKSLTSRVTGLADTTEAKLSRLSESVSSERKALAEERAKFSGKLADTNHSIASLAESLKSMDSRIRERKADESEKSQKLRAVESAVRSLSAEVSGLKKGLQSDMDFDASYKKRMLELEASVKKVASSVSGLESSLKTVSVEIKRKSDSAASSDEGLDKELEKSKETIRQLIEASRTSHEMSKKRIESLESAIRLLSEKLCRNEKAMENQMADMKEKMTKAEETRVRVKESEMKDYFEKTLKERYESEVSRMRSETARLVKEITEWKEEQAKLYELLKEE